MFNDFMSPNEAEYQMMRMGYSQSNSKNHMDDPYWGMSPIRGTKEIEESRHFNSINNEKKANNSHNSIMDNSDTGRRPSPAMGDNTTNRRENNMGRILGRGFPWQGNPIANIIAKIRNKK